MSIFEKMFGTGHKKSSDIELEGTERRAYERETETIRRDKRRKDIEAAERRGTERARRKSEGARGTIVRGAKAIGGGIREFGEFGASLNWQGDYGRSRKSRPHYKHKKSHPHKKGRYEATRTPSGININIGAPEPRQTQPHKKKSKSHRRKSYDPFALPRLPF